MAGKTAEEVGRLSEQMYTELRSGSRGYSAPQQPQQPYQPQQPQQPYQPQQPQYDYDQQYQQQPQQDQYGGPPTADDWATDPAGAAQRDWQYRLQTQIQPAMNQYASVIGQQARTLAEMRDPDSFKRWGPEIDLTLRGIAPEYHTVENIQRVVEMVKGKHVDELANERAEQRYREMLERGGPETFRPDGTSLGPTSTSAGGRIDLERAELPNAYRRLLARHNVTPDVLDEFLLKTEVEKRGITLTEAREEWLKKAQSGDIITEERLHIGNEGGVF